MTPERSGAAVGRAPAVGEAAPAGPAGATTSAAVDAEAFAALFQAEAGRVYRLLLRLGIAERDAEDLCQEVFVTAHRCWGDFRGSAKRSTWLCGIAVRLAANHRRRARVRRERLHDQPGQERPSGAPNPESELAASERTATLHRVLDGLPENWRQVLVLYELEGLAMAEAASMIGIPLQTGYSRLHAARKELRAALERLRLRGEL